VSAGFEIFDGFRFIAAAANEGEKVALQVDAIGRMRPTKVQSQDAK
jgi:hypothetical protein